MSVDTDILPDGSTRKSGKGVSCFTLTELLACLPKPLDPRFIFQSIWEDCRGVWRRQAKATFTLTELLVIIAIIVMLVTLLLPALETAIIVSHGPACKNNMKNIGSGLAMYTSDWNGRFCGANGWSNTPQDDYAGGGNDGRGYCWARRLYNAGYYAKTGKTHSGPTTWDNNEAWKCPEYRRFTGNVWSSHATYYGTQVLMKWPLSWGTPPNGYDEAAPVIWYSDIPSPMRRCVVLEVTSDLHYYWGGPYNQWQLVKLGYPGYPGTTMLGNIALDLYHLRRPNFLYADFHVGTLNRVEFYQVCDVTGPGRCGRPILLPFD